MTTCEEYLQVVVSKFNLLNKRLANIDEVLKVFRRLLQYSQPRRWYAFKLDYENHSLESIYVNGEAYIANDLSTWKLTDDVILKLDDSEAIIKQLNVSERIYHLDQNYKGTKYSFEIKRVPNKYEQHTKNIY